MQNVLDFAFSERGLDSTIIWSDAASLVTRIYFLTRNGQPTEISDLTLTSTPSSLLTLYRNLIGNTAGEFPADCMVLRTSDWVNVAFNLRRGDIGRPYIEAYTPVARLGPGAYRFGGKGFQKEAHKSYEGIDDVGKSPQFGPPLYAYCVRGDGGSSTIQVELLDVFGRVPGISTVIVDSASGISLERLYQNNGLSLPVTVVNALVSVVSGSTLVYNTAGHGVPSINGGMKSTLDPNTNSRSILSGDTVVFGGLAQSSIAGGGGGSSSDATAANQVTGNTTLSNINAKLENVWNQPGHWLRTYSTSGSSLLEEALPSITSSTQIFANAPATTKRVRIELRTAPATVRFDAGAATAGGNGVSYTTGVYNWYFDSQEEAKKVRAIEFGGTTTGWIQYFGG